MKVIGVSNLPANKTKQSSSKNKKTVQNEINSPNFGAYKLIKKFKDPNYSWINDYVYELSNKMKVIIVPKKGPDAISVKTIVKTGAYNETENLRGESHFTEHLMFDGSKGLKPGEFDTITSSKGAYINAYTDTNATQYIFDVTNPSSKDLADLIKIHATMIKYPSLPEEQFEKEKAIVIQEIKQHQDEPMAMHYFKLIKDLLGINSKPTHAILGDEENIRNTQRKDIFNYHKENYTPDNMEIIIAGDINPKKIIKEIDKNFDTPDFKPSEQSRMFEKIHPLEKTKISFLSDPKIQSSYINIGLNGPENINAKDNVAAQALQTILCSSKRIDSKLLQIDTECYHELISVGNNPTNPRVLFFTMSVMPGNEQKALNLLKEAISEIKTKPITEEELTIAKKTLINLFNKKCEKNKYITESICDFSSVGGIDAYEKQVEYIKNLTLDDVNKIAYKYLNPQKAAISILQPETAQNKAISFSGRNIIQPKSIREYLLPNNIKLVINDTSYKIRTHLDFTIRNTNINSKPGTIDILGQILEKSTSKHSKEDFRFLQEKEGIDLHLRTGKDMSINSNSLKESLPSAIKLIKEMLFEPKINKESFDKAINELSLQLNGFTIDASDRAIEKLYGKSPDGITARLLRQEITKVTLEDVQNYYNKIINQGNATITITGPISKQKGLKKEIIKELSQIENKFKLDKIKEQSFNGPKTTQVLVQAEKGLSQSEIIQMFHLDTTDINEIAAMNVLDFILGSGGLNTRLFLDLRENQKLAYDASSNFIQKESYARENLRIKTGIKDENDNFNENIKKSLLGFEKHLKILTQSTPTEQEMITAKKSLFNALVIEAANAHGENYLIKQGIEQNNEALYINKLLKAIEKVKPKDVQEVAKKYLTKPSIISILTTEEAAKNAEAFLKTRGEYKFYANEKIDT